MLSHSWFPLCGRDSGLIASAKELRRRVRKQLVTSFCVVATACRVPCWGWPRRGPIQFAIARASKNYEMRFGIFSWRPVLPARKLEIIHAERLQLKCTDLVLFTSLPMRRRVDDSTGQTD